MAYSDNYAAALNIAFQQRVQGSMIAAAISISAEATSTADHGNRVALARQVMQSPQSWVQSFSFAVAVNLAVTSVSAVTDAQIDTSVAAIWNAMAGVP